LKFEGLRSVYQAALSRLGADSKPSDLGVPEVPFFRLQPNHGLLVFEVLGCVIPDLNEALLVFICQVEGKNGLADDALLKNVTCGPRKVSYLHY
jgi:hypothetical protein